LWENQEDYPTSSSRYPLGKSDPPAWDLFICAKDLFVEANA
jgi:hypothetical protein